MQCAPFGCETRAKNCMDEVIRFRKQNLANSIGFKHGICSVYLFLSGVIFFMYSWGFPEF